MDENKLVALSILGIVALLAVTGLVLLFAQTIRSTGMTAHDKPTIGDDYERFGYIDYEKYIPPPYIPLPPYVEEYKPPPVAPPKTYGIIRSGEPPPIESPDYLGDEPDEPFFEDTSTPTYDD